MPIAMPETENRIFVPFEVLSDFQISFGILKLGQRMTPFYVKRVGSPDRCNQLLSLTI